MVIYESETISRDKLHELRKSHHCKECGGLLGVFMDSEKGRYFLACSDYRENNHEGVIKIEYNGGILCQ